MSELARRLGTTDAVVVGLGSMIGAGVFAAFAPAAQALVVRAGAEAAATGLILALVVAAAVAYANATSSAQLAARYPTSGGTYVYGRERLGPWWGYVAGWGFVVGKTASCAAMALTFAAYAAPAGWEKPVAVAAVALLAAVNYRGVTRTARLARWIVAFVLLALGLMIAISLSAGSFGGTQWSTPAAFATPSGVHGLLQAAGLLFFAFAGYARIATMGEEVRDPRRSIPRAIVVALALTVVVYLGVAVTVLVTLGPAGIASSPVPLAASVERAGMPWAEVLVRAGAAAASLGALLALIAGVGRTSLAMAREDDLPRWLAAVHPRYRVPHRAEVALAVVVCVLVLLVDLRGAIGFSSFGVLVYYLVANVSAWTQPTTERLFPRWFQAVGMVGCVALVLSLPASAVIGGSVVLLAGIAERLVRLGRARPD
ncbi:APC family permease [Antribacter sp. KLBMP9083]|uniref:APC family permease n=1 Tax=Antribacter soli TaxID=2910976 RepID=A0AA41QCJ5_9MICO|nr:APC family permease [Antribacter soli]MCF4120940.1 APC family permease [Antribacter soli]